MFGHAQYNLYNIFTILNHYKYRCLNIFFTTISHLIFDISNTTKIEQSRIQRIPSSCLPFPCFFPLPLVHVAIVDDKDNTTYNGKKKRYE